MAVRETANPGQFYRLTGDFCGPRRARTDDPRITVIRFLGVSCDLQPLDTTGIEHQSTPKCFCNILAFLRNTCGILARFLALCHTERNAKGNHMFTNGFIAIVLGLPVLILAIFLISVAVMIPSGKKKD